MNEQSEVARIRNTLLTHLKILTAARDMLAAEVQKLHRRYTLTCSLAEHWSDTGLEASIDDAQNALHRLETSISETEARLRTLGEF